jgi:hypothetical protein
MASAAPAWAAITASLVACGTTKSTVFGEPGGTDGGVASDDGSVDAPGLFGGGDGALGKADGASASFDVEPSALQTITVTAGQTTPTVLYSATSVATGAPIAVAWVVDRGEIGAIGAGPSTKATFQPTGTTGGLVDVIAGLGGQTVKRQVFVQITGTQNGANTSAPGEGAQVPTSVGQLGQGGGIGGVGGEGLGGAVTDPTTLGALQNPTSNGQSQGLAMLYPYDHTVFPRGLLAPLLQWKWTTGDADAVQIQLATTSGSFSWTGTFARPAILAQTGGKFIRHPIPQDVWAMATNTAGGPTPNGTHDQLTMKLVVAKGGQGYGPIAETWTIAPGRLAGTVYYNSYGTNLVKNSVENSYGGGPQFGAAVLAIQGGATAPSVVAGTNSPLGSGSGCRVCHVVSSDGSTLIVQHGDATDTYATTSAYNLKSGNTETVLTGYDGIFPWAGLSANGALALTNTGDLAAASTASQLYSFPPASPAPLAANGIPADLGAATPAFSPDGKHVAFDFLGGTIGATFGSGQLVSLDFNAATNTFSNLRVLATPSQIGAAGAGFPSFLPTDDAVAFHYQVMNTPTTPHLFDTWKGATAQIWWSDLATGTASALYQLNGMSGGGASSYLPTGPNKHGDDAVLNYEPSVNPVASGGYIWIVFTSRRLYGSVATADPWQSDPRLYDATQLANTTCKKLWVAAVDLGAKPGTDPSHPAFYLPAQELLAGNARGFWVAEPCRPDGSSCQTGDQCCNGYCEAGEGGLVCANVPPNTTCSQVQEKCTTSADCCDTTNLCINGFCSIATPQ